MDLLVQGLLIGLTLTVLVGPITFTILDSSLARGATHGVIAASGMWFSDLLFITACYFGAQPLRLFMQSEDTSRIAGLVGGSVLIVIGIFVWRSRTEQNTERVSKKWFKAAGDWVRGFIVNTFAPFSFVFWSTVTLTIVLPNATSLGHAAMFYIGVMASIMAGDTLKAVFAGWVSHRVSNRVIYRSRTVLAVLFIGAGLVVLGRVVWYAVQ